MVRCSRAARHISSRGAPPQRPDLSESVRLHRRHDRARHPAASDRLRPRRTALKTQLDQALSGYKQTGELEASVGGTEEGFGRLDALNRIGNQVFAIDLK